MTILAAAKAFVSRGISVVPVNLTDKKATVAWARFQKTCPTDIEIAALFEHAEGVAAIAGAVSGCLECVDFDDPELFPKWEELLKDAGHGDVLARLVVQQTKSGGFHAVYRCPDGVEGNQKLARHMGEDRHGRPVPVVDIETRGEGGYFIAWPSKGYTKVRGTWANIPEIDGETRDVLLSAARMLSDMTSKAVTEQTAMAYMKRPGDEYARSHTWAEILEPHGWALSHERNGEAYWVRPGKTRREGTGATTNYRGSDLLKVFTSNGHPFEADCTYTKFGAYAQLEHRGNLVDAARALGAKGYGEPIPTKKPYQGPQPVQDAPTRQRQRWVTMDDIEEREVEWLWRHYIAIGEVQMIVGDPGEGKSTVAQAIVTAVSRGATLFGDEIPQGESVFLSAEQSVNSITKPRFRQMGADMRRIVCPDEVDENDEPVPFVLDKSGIAELRDVCLERRPKLVVVDTVTAYIEASRDFNSANQVREWMRRLAEIARSTPCAVLLIGHLNKNQNAHPLQRVMGSMDFVGASRVVLLVGKDPDEPDTRGLCVIKSNLGPFGAPVGFSLKEGEFSWTDGSTLDATKMLQPPAIKAAESNRDRCRAWLKSLFKDTSVVDPPREVDGKIGGFTTYMVTSVKKELGVVSRTDPMTESGYAWAIDPDNGWWSR